MIIVEEKFMTVIVMFVNSTADTRRLRRVEVQTTAKQLHLHAHKLQRITKNGDVVGQELLCHKRTSNIASLRNIITRLTTSRVREKGGIVLTPALTTMCIGFAVGVMLPAKHEQTDTSSLLSVFEIVDSFVGFGAVMM